jgi:hypothetical protein
LNSLIRIYLFVKKLEIFLDLRRNEKRFRESDWIASGTSCRSPTPASGGKRFDISVSYFFFLYRNESIALIFEFVQLSLRLSSVV